jgi:adducin
MSQEVVTRRSGKRIESKAKRWSAPPSNKSFSPAVNSPEQITRDVRGLKLRQRVSIVLGDEILREELEEVVGNVDVTNKTTNLQSFRTYQDFLVPTSGMAGGGTQGVRVTPIADIRGMETIKFSKEERLLRCKIAAVYRLAQEFNWLCSAYDQVLCTVS